LIKPLGRNLFAHPTGVPNVRLSPKSIFFGLIALGLPISVVIGWTLATPLRSPASVGASAGTGGLGTGGGTGGIGAAPRRGDPSQPVTEVQYAPRPAPSSVIPPATAPSSAPMPTTAPPSAATSAEPPLPTLDQPPVPTPTEISVTPTVSTGPSAGADPSEQPESGIQTGTERPDWRPEP
jgi:hypothetical protein